eukprot:scaffold95871_cov60-Phaeocystis_antarctica.AAC.1
MTKRMHVLHGNGTDEALNLSFGLNPGKSRLGSRGPWSSKLLGDGEKADGGFGLGRGEPSKVWDKIGDELDKYEGIEKDGNTNNGNVHVEDCTPWNTVASHNGHSYQFAPEAVAYYLKHMTKGVAARGATARGWRLDVSSHLAVYVMRLVVCDDHVSCCVDAGTLVRLDSRRCPSFASSTGNKAAFTTPEARPPHRCSPC